MVNPLIRKIPNTLRSHKTQHKSAGILDDFAERKVVQTKEFRVSGVWHAFGGFQDAATTITLAADTYAKITNATGDLFEGMEVDGFDLIDDEIIILHEADYFGSISMSNSAIAGKDFHFRIFNVTQNKTMGYEMGVSTTGAANKTLMAMPIYLEVNKGDVLQMQVKSADGTDAVLNDCIFYLSYLHE